MRGGGWWVQGAGWWVGGGDPDVIDLPLFLSTPDR